VHERTIGNSAGGQVPVAAHEDDDGTIVCGRWVDDAPAVPTVQRFARPDGHVDRWQFYHLKPPCTSWVDFGSFETGRPHTALEQACAPYRMLSYAFLTPIDGSTTHYFSFQLRNFLPDDPTVTEELNVLYKATFEEDRELLEAIQREEDTHPGLQPVRIASDVGVVRLRRATTRLLASEQLSEADQPG
jgi:vanillate O-demethylase monooxygenase subunit